MKCRVHVYLMNEHFSEEHANEHHGGQESENNLRHEWEDELLITSDVVGINFIEDAIFPLRGEMPDGKAFHHEVKHMSLYEIQSSDSPTTYVGASKSIVDHCDSAIEDGIHKIFIYLKDYEPMANPIPGIYIASKEFPKELIF